MGKLKMLGPTLKRLPPAVGFLERDTQAQASRARDARLEWRKWYKTANWQRLRWSVLQRDLFTCAMCGRIESDTSQLVADHKVPHRGDEAKFWDLGNLQCLCKPCHDSAKQRLDAGGYVVKPDWIDAPACPVTLVCGPPASGKSTYIADRASAGDVVIDLDVIACDLAGHEFRHDWDRALWLGPAMRQRNQMLADLARVKSGAAWFIVSAPKRIDRDWWQAKLNAEVVVLEVPAAECRARAQAQGRADSSDVWLRAQEWWAKYRQ